MLQLVRPSVSSVSRRGTMSVQFLVILVPVLLGMMGFAVDLGRLYLVRGELNQAASAMAIAAAAVAGISAPVCTACGIEPFAIQRADRGDTDSVDFGFVPGNLYTFGYQCAPGAPTQLAGQNTTGRIDYLLINRLDAGSSLV